MGKVIQIHSLRYINRLTGHAYEHLDDVPREVLLKLMGVGCFVSFQLDTATPTELEWIAEEFDFFSLVDKAEEVEEECDEPAP